MSVDDGIGAAVASNPVGIAGRDADAALDRAEPPRPQRAPGAPDPRTSGALEEASAVQDVVTRLKASWPALDEAAVETAVRSAYDSFRQARVTAYIPVLVERRVRRALEAAVGDRAARSEEPPPEEEAISDVGRKRRAHRLFHRVARRETGLQGPAGPGLRPS
ncbi:three-helix bundle dimerization domain-containing protein [Streptomyces sp. NPDC086783]|uniref:three-helix bundle dimerization domain-containing protein n=1 Tax=Streptomyces sp. NPDC086783 TaxID=3365758 RepID=UPI00380AC918